MAEWLIFPAADAAKLERRLPPTTPGGRGSERGPALAEAAPSPSEDETAPASPARPFVTLTFATSLDSSLALAPGVRTAISGPESKAMTHFLRSRHDAILVGAGTAVADDPGLNCRLAASPSGGARGPGDHPRPVVLDPRGRWCFSERSKVMRLANSGTGMAPFVIITPAAFREVSADKRAILEAHGGKYIVLEQGQGQGRKQGQGQGQGEGSTAAEDGSGCAMLDWPDILAALYAEGIRSVMVEGGGHVINTLLGNMRERSLVDSVIITIAPIWLGRGGVVVSPDMGLDGNGTPLPAPRLANVSWHQLGDDMVLCGEL